MTTLDCAGISLANANVQLSATMLGDQADPKSKTTFKSAIRGRRKKTVAFAAPTYVDYEDYDYSSDEEDMEELFAQQQALAAQQREQSAQQAAAAEEEMDDETAKVEPLKPRLQKEAKAAEPIKEEDPKEDEKRSSDETYDKPSVSRNGTVRNTDSFFKDDTVETKKITLTPNLLRDDNTPRASTDSKELRQRPSLDRLDKDSLLGKDRDDKKRKDKKDKGDKKPSAIRSFFSRKDKKKSPEDDDESIGGGKPSMDMGSEPLEREGGDGQADEPAAEKGGAMVQRNPSKLQKPQPRTEPSPTRKATAPAPKTPPTLEYSSYLASETRPNDVSNVPPTSMRIVQPEQQQDAVEGPGRPRDRSPEVARTNGVAQPRDERNGLGLGLGLSQGPAQISKPQIMAVPAAAKSRLDLDDFDSVEEELLAATYGQPQPQPQQARETSQERAKPERPQRPILPGSYPDSYLSSQTTSSTQSDRTTTAASVSASAAATQQQQQQSSRPQPERLSESPVQVSPVNGSNPPALMVDTSSQEDRDSSSPSPELIDADEAMMAAGSQRHRDGGARSGSASTAGGASAASREWNDVKLREFFDSGTDIRDMLVVVYDKTDVVPAGPDHPVVGTLFREQNAKLAEITTVSFVPRSNDGVCM